MEGKNLIETMDFTAQDIKKISEDYNKRYQSIWRSKKRKNKLKSINKRLIRLSKNPITTIKRVAFRTISQAISN